AIFITDTYSRYLFNGMPVFFLWIAALTALFVVLGRKKAEEEQKIPVTVFAMWIVWATFAIISFFVIRFRLIMFVGFIAYSLWVFVPLIKKKLKNVKLTDEDVMALMTVGTSFAHAAFIALAYLDHIIYLSYSLVAFIPAFWYAIDKSFQKLDVKPERKRIVCAIPVVITVIGCLMPFVTRDIRFIFEDDRELVSAVSAYQDENPDANVVLMTKSKELQGDALDCIWQMDDDTNIYINDYEELEYTAGIYPDDFLLWTESYRDMSLFFDGLTEEGYSYSKLGEDHICIVYEVER
nr:hypothetical protein [Lachnospiraceae bacterium]